MGAGDERRRAPSSERRQLAAALAAAALGQSANVPLIYAIDALAQRWHVHPRVIEDDPDPSWVLRGLTFMRLEAQAQRKKADKR